MKIVLAGQQTVSISGRVSRRPRLLTKCCAFSTSTDCVYSAELMRTAGEGPQPHPADVAELALEAHLPIEPVVAELEKLADGKTRHVGDRGRCHRLGFFWH